MIAELISGLRILVNPDQRSLDHLSRRRLLWETQTSKRSSGWRWERRRSDQTNWEESNTHAAVQIHSKKHLQQHLPADGVHNWRSGGVEAFTQDAWTEPLVHMQWGGSCRPVTQSWSRGGHEWVETAGLRPALQKPHQLWGGWRAEGNSRTRHWGRSRQRAVEDADFKYTRQMREQSTAKHSLTNKTGKPTQHPAHRPGDYQSKNQGKSEGQRERARDGETVWGEERKTNINYQTCWATQWNNRETDNLTWRKDWVQRRTLGQETRHKRTGNEKRKPPITSWDLGIQTDIKSITKTRTFTSEYYINQNQKSKREKIQVQNPGSWQVRAEGKRGAGCSSGLGSGFVVVLWAQHHLKVDK